MAGYGSLIVRRTDERIRAQAIGPKTVVYALIAQGVPLEVVGHFIREQEVATRIEANPALRAITCTGIQPDVKLEADLNLPS